MVKKIRLNPQEIKALKDVIYYFDKNAKIAYETGVLI